MFIVECLPFSKGLNKDLLSYFSSTHLEPGSLVKVNLRGRSVDALVLQSKDAVESKSEIKSANFQLKKVTAFTSKPFLKKEFLGAVKKTSDFFVSSEGSILSQLIPSFILEDPNLLNSFKDNTKENYSESDTAKAQSKKTDIASITQSEDEERFLNYRSLIREEFARKKSVFLCMPQNEGIQRAREKIERGIEAYVATFYKDMSKKDFKREWKKTQNKEHPVVIIGTARWLFIPRSDFGTIVIEKENENGWKTMTRPFIDLRYFAEALAKESKIRIVFGDSFLRTETLFRYKEGELIEFENVKWRLPKNVDYEVVDLREKTKKEKEFSALSPELLEMIRETKANSSHIFVFAGRKGLSPLTICRDCGEEVKCNNCLSPMVLYRKNLSTEVGGTFRCHQCGETRDAAEYCQNCQSWKLAAFGSGVDRVASEIRKHFPDINLFEINKDIVPSSVKAAGIVKSFYDTKGSVLVGTEMTFPYLHKKVAYSAIASFDSLFSIPDFRIREKIFKIILQVKNIAKKKFLIQTRNFEDSTILFALIGNIVEFYAREIEERKILGYPPFGIFIKVTARGTKIAVAKETLNFKKLLGDYGATIFYSSHEKKGEQAAVNAVIKLRNEEWPNPSLSTSGANNYDLPNTLKSLPPSYEIKVDPDNLL